MKKKSNLGLNIFYVIFVIIVAFAIWLPNYIVEDQGVSVNAEPSQVYQCLLKSNNWSLWGWELADASSLLGKNMNLKWQGQNFVITQLEPDEFMNLSGKPVSISITLEADDEQTWLTYSTELKVGKNPFKKLYQYFINDKVTRNAQNMAHHISKTCQNIE